MPDIYPETIATFGGSYWTLVNGKAGTVDLPNLIFTIQGEYNNRPLYRNGTWRIYYRQSANKWVLGFTEPGENYSDGTTGIKSDGKLFSIDV